MLLLYYFRACLRQQCLTCVEAFCVSMCLPNIDCHDSVFWNEIIWLLPHGMIFWCIRPVLGNDHETSSSTSLQLVCELVKLWGSLIVSVCYEELSPGTVQESKERGTFTVGTRYQTSGGYGYCGHLCVCVWQWSLKYSLKLYVWEPNKCGQDWVFWNSSIIRLNVYPECYSVIRSVWKPLLESLSHP
jgi:hypothetical protein